jgi:hypothetical protein
MAIKILGLRRDFQQGTDEVDVEKSQFKPKFHAANEQLFADLFTNDPNYILVSSSPKVFSAIHEEDFTENFYIHEEELEEYLDGFISVIKENGDDTIESTQEDTDQILRDAALDDKDIKLSLYRSFKSLYDKWIASSKDNIGDNSGYFFNNYGKDDDRLLYDHFSFINRTGAEIGGKAVIDPAYLSNLANADNGQGGPTQSLYQTITGLLSKNNFDFFALPSFITYSEEDDTSLTDMFRAFDGPLNSMPAKPSFLCMYIGGNSRTLDIPRSRCSNKNLIDFDYTNDSFDINDPQQYPEDFKDNGGITAFKVRYGQEAQNHFSSLQLDQAEFKETQESLMVIDALANPRQGNSPATAGKGNNIYDMYLTRGYSCTVSALGNMNIQPLMYFKLENVPMFRGTYLITNVNHKITPHKVETEFKGTRQPIITAPLVKDPISLVDLLLSNEGFEGTLGTLGSTTTSAGSGEPTPIVSDIDPNALVQVNSKPATNAPKFMDVINVMKKKKGTFNSRELGNKYGEGDKLFKDIKKQLIDDGIYKPNESYKILEGDFLVNIVSIRSYIQIANTFDDFLTVFYVDPKGTESYNGKKWTYKAWQITTDPGKTALGSSGAGSKNPLGSAIVAEGQYLGGYETGRHRASEDWNNYTCVQNTRNILVYKDGDKDIWAEKDTNKLYVYTCGCNLHASGAYTKDNVVDGWSAGCQVFKNPKDYAEFIYITYFLAKNNERENRTTTLRLKSKGGCSKCSKTLTDFIPDELKSAMKDGTQINKKIFNYTLLNSADFGSPANIKTGDDIYENYVNSGMSAS